MKFSQLPFDALDTLTDEQVTQIVFGAWQDDGGSAEVALLLGGDPVVCPERANAAAKLWHAGRVKYIMPSGGVEWQSHYGRFSEAELLRRLLLEEGVAEDAILLENEATTTVENMIFATLRLSRLRMVRSMKRICVVTSSSHLRRSLAHGANYLPRHLEISGFCVPRSGSDRESWVGDPIHDSRVRKELVLIKKLVDAGQMTDIDY